MNLKTCVPVVFLCVAFLPHISTEFTHRKFIHVFFLYSPLHTIFRVLPNTLPPPTFIIVIMITISIIIISSSHYNYNDNDNKNIDVLFIQGSPNFKQPIGYGERVVPVLMRNFSSQQINTVPPPPPRAMQSYYYCQHHYHHHHYNNSHLTLPSSSSLNLCSQGSKASNIH